jgi:hypothetical protein
MQATNATCSLNARACDAPQAPTPGEEHAVTHGARDISPASSGIIDIRQEILPLSDHGVYAIPVNISTDANGKEDPSFPGGDWRSFKTIEYWKAHIHVRLRSSSQTDSQT